MALVILPKGSTSINLQAAIDGAAFGDIIQLSGDMPFFDTVTVRESLEVTIQSEANSNWIMYQFSPAKRHFQINGGSLILENIIVDGRNDSGGVQLNRGAFALQHGAVVQNCSAENGGGVEVIAGVFSIYDGNVDKPFPLKGGEVRNNTAQNGGGVYLNSGLFNMSTGSGFISGNKAENGGGVYVATGTYRLTGGDVIDNEAENGGGIYVSSLATVQITGTVTSITNNSALSGHGGGIYTENTTYSNLTISRIVFRCNKASVAYSPPAGAGTLYPNILFSETTITEHPLNNYDINYTGEEPITATHNVAYSANGGTGSHIGRDIGPCETDTVLSLEDTGISREGHVFTGWNTNPDGSGIPYAPGDEITLTDNLILYAQWEANLCTVTYHSNGGRGSYTDTDIPFGTAYMILSPDETGIGHASYTFIGWNTRPDGSGRACVPGDTAIIRADLTLYAQWEAKLCTVTYVANGGIGSYVDTDISCGKKYTVLSLKETGMSRTRYTLLSWNTKPDGSGISYVPGDRITLLGNVILYAQWKTEDKPHCREFCNEFRKEFCKEFCREFCCGEYCGCHEKCKCICEKTSRKICDKLCGRPCDNANFTVG